MAFIIHTDMAYLLHLEQHMKRRRSLAVAAAMKTNTNFMTVAKTVVAAVNNWQSVISGICAETSGEQPY